MMHYFTLFYVWVVFQYMYMCVCVYICMDGYGYIGEGHANPLPYSCLENPVDRGACRATPVYGVAKSGTQLSHTDTHVYIHTTHLGLPRLLIGKESTCKCWWCGFDPWVRKIPCRRKWQCTLVFLPETSRGRRSLVGYSPWGRKTVRRDLATKQQRTTPLPFHLPVNVSSTSELLCMLLLWIFGCVCPFKLGFSLDIYPGVGPLNPVVILLWGF